MKFIDCGKGKDSWAFDGDQIWNKWKQDKNSSACFTEDGFPYGIYVKAVNLIVDNSMITRCAYSMFWGLQVFYLEFTLSSLFLLSDPFYSSQHLLTFF